jgi:hypothetical protein
MGTLWSYFGPTMEYIADKLGRDYRGYTETDREYGSDVDSLLEEEE